MFSFKSVIDLDPAYEVARRERRWPDDVVNRFRDLLLIRTGELMLVVACDSNASIGNKPADHLRQDPAITGLSASKVPLMEVIASGATPLVVVDNLCCALEPDGYAILAGINRALAGTVGGVTVTGSDETNMPTVQTGVGVTVIGVARSSDLLLGQARPGDLVAVVGIPKDGLRYRYSENDVDVASVEDVDSVVRSGLVHELLPVGSRGVAYEADQLALTAGLEVVLDTSCGIDLVTSAGSSTCFLVAVGANQVDMLEAATLLPVTVVGSLAETQGVDESGAT